MKNIILFNLSYHILLFILPLVIVIIFEGYGTEMFAYAFYFSLMYLLIGFILDSITLVIFNYFKVVKSKWILFFLLSITIFLLTVYVLTNKNILLELFTSNLSSNYASIIFIISFFLSFYISLKLIKPDAQLPPTNRS
ncbi:putative membrane protein [Chryseobacterium lathyri]|uniref:Membrane protein n=1 Tax=Chryseobacterium lathyri TaxID=395933 RepID=A0ABT9SI53_9FLAO|nr:putative membrane protein [Chryseobacterium lathyri]